MKIEQAQLIDEKEKRKQLEEEILNLRGRVFNESWSSRAIMGRAERLQNILRLSDETGLPIRLIEARSWLELEVMNILIDNGEKEVACQVATDPGTVREKRPELFDQARTNTIILKDGRVIERWVE